LINKVARLKFQLANSTLSFEISGAGGVNQMGEDYLEVMGMLEQSDNYVVETASLLNEGDAEVELMEDESMEDESIG